MGRAIERQSPRVGFPASRPRIWIAAAVVVLAVVGAVLRAEAVHRSVELGKHINGDSLSYFLVADTIRDLVLSALGRVELTPDWRINGLFVRGVVYPAFVALLGGGTHECAQDILYGRGSQTCPVESILTANVLLGGVTIILTFFLAASLANFPVGLAASALATFIPSLVNVAGAALTEPFRIPILAGAAITLRELQRRPRITVALCSGLVVALAAASHSVTTALPAVMTAWVWLFARPRSPAMVTLFVAPSVLFWVAWALAGLLWFGEPVPPGVGGKGFGGGAAWSALMGSRTELDGHTLPSDEEYVTLPLTPRLLERMASDGSDPSLPPLEPEVAAWIAEHGISQPIPDHVFWSAYRNRFLRDPVGFAWLTLRKGWRLVSAFDFDQSLFQDGPLPLSRPLHLSVLTLAMFGLLLPQSPLDRAGRALLAAVPLYLLGIHSLGIPQARYWTPALPFLSILAAAGGYALLAVLLRGLRGCRQRSEAAYELSRMSPTGHTTKSRVQKNSR